MSDGIEGRGNWEERRGRAAHRPECGRAHGRAVEVDSPARSVGETPGASEPASVILMAKQRLAQPWRRERRCQLVRLSLTGVTGCCGGAARALAYSSPATATWESPHRTLSPGQEARSPPLGRSRLAGVIDADRGDAPVRWQGAGQQPCRQRRRARRGRSRSSWWEGGKRVERYRCECATGGPRGNSRRVKRVRGILCTGHRRWKEEMREGEEEEARETRSPSPRRPRRFPGPTPVWAGQQRHPSGSGSP